MSNAEPVAFRRLLAAHATSAAGDALLAIALAGTLFFGISASAARLNVGLYLLLTMAPFSLLAPLIGPWMDRASGGRRAAIVVAGAGRAALALAMAAASDTFLLYPAAFGALVLSRAHGVARNALLPAVLGEDRTLVAANAMVARTGVIAGALAAIPGVVVALVSARTAPLLLAAVVYGMDAAAGASLPRSGERAAPPEDAHAPFEVPRRVRVALVVNAAIRALAGFLLFLLAFALKRRGVSGTGFGFALAAAGTGSFLGATFVPRLRRATNEEWILAVSLLAGGVASLAAARTFGLDLAAIVAAAMGFISSGGRLAFDSMVQRDAKDRIRGRAFARFETTFQLAWVIGAAVPVILPPAWTTSDAGIRFWLRAAAIVFFTLAAWFLVALGPRGRRDLSR